MGAKLIVLTLCCIGTVFLWGTAAQITGPAPSLSPSPAPSLSPSPDPSSVSVEPSVSSPQAESTTGSNVSESTPADNTTVVAQTTMVGGVVSSDELSEGEIAGIAIGSVAGVALIGGGIFGALKYTGKI